MFEHFRKPLISRARFVKRLLIHLGFSMLLIVISLLMGMAGYHWICGLSPADSLLNAAMILTGMGPVSPLTGDGAKIFASIYALYSGIAFLSLLAVAVAPVLHRFLHRLHVDEGD